MERKSDHELVVALKCGGYAGWISFIVVRKLLLKFISGIQIVVTGTANYVFQWYANISGK